MESHEGDTETTTPIEPDSNVPQEIDAAAVRAGMTPKRLEELDKIYPPRRKAGEDHAGEFPVVKELVGSKK